jgi:hypothetical protein
MKLVLVIVFLTTTTNGALTEHVWQRVMASETDCQKKAAEIKRRLPHLNAYCTPPASKMVGASQSLIVK